MFGGKLWSGEWACQHHTYVEYFEIKQRIEPKDVR